MVGSWGAEKGPRASSTARREEGLQGRFDRRAQRSSGALAVVDEVLKPSGGCGQELRRQSCASDAGQAAMGGEGLQATLPPSALICTPLQAKEL